MTTEVEAQILFIDYDKVLQLIKKMGAKQFLISVCQ